MIEKIENFINYGNKLSDDAVLYAAVSHMAVVLISFAFVYNLKYTIINIPFAILTLIVYFFSKKNKDKGDKNKFFSIGIISIIASLNCQIICCFFVKMNMVKIIKFESIVLAANFVVFLMMVISAKLMISSKKAMQAYPVSASLIAPFAVAGVLFSRKFVNANFENGILFFIFFSLIFSIFTIYLIKWHYMNVVEKLKKEDNTCNGSVS